MHFLNKVLLRISISTPASTGTAVKIRKKLDKPYDSEIESIKLPVQPRRNWLLRCTQTKIQTSNQPIVLGASLLT